MTEKPRQQLVTLYDGRKNAGQYARTASQEHYLQDIRAKTKLYSLALCALIAGALLVMVVFRIGDRYPNSDDWLQYAFYIPIGIFRCGWYVLVEATKIEPVRPVAAPKEDRFAPREILLRPSQSPPSQQRAELLRAAQAGQETPPEELLRAAVGTRIMSSAFVRDRSIQQGDEK